MNNILFQDQDILVIEKPTGVIVNNAATTDNDLTVQTQVKEFIEDTEDPDDSEYTDRGGVVHRIDKDTSGVLLIAKNAGAFKDLQKQFKDRTVEKVYFAIVHGALKENSILVNAPLGRNPNNRFKFAIVHSGKPAETRFEQICYYSWENSTFSLIKAKPKTGRTHQIRVHLTALNCPIVGDPVYLSKKSYEQDQRFISRMLLHAHQISFIHPVTKEKVTITSPLPSEFLIFDPYKI